MKERKSQYQNRGFIQPRFFQQTITKFTSLIPSLHPLLSVHGLSVHRLAIHRLCIALSIAIVAHSLLLPLLLFLLLFLLLSPYISATPWHLPSTFPAPRSFMKEVYSSFILLNSCSRRLSLRLGQSLAMCPESPQISHLISLLPKSSTPQSSPRRSPGRLGQLNWSWPVIPQ